MHVAVLIIVFLFTLILPNLINRLFPKVPLPLIQIVFGGLLCLIFGEQFVSLDSELFLAFVIAPLLFREGEESDITNVLRHWKIILYLIFLEGGLGSWPAVFFFFFFNHPIFG